MLIQLSRQERTSVRDWSIDCRTELPQTAQLLTDGGDGRIVCNADGFNRYGCASQPDPELLAFGSSTASTISQAGFAAAESLRQRLVRAAILENSSTIYKREMDRLRSELTFLWGLEDLAGLKIIFGASGTDLHLFISQLMVETGHDRPLIVCVDPEETGRGVPSALTGAHFSDSTALGRNVVANSPLDCGRPIDVLKVKCRTEEGKARSVEEVNAEVEQAVSEAANKGRRVLIAMADLSKTGLIAPGPDCVLALKRRFPKAVEVLVDACQVRLQGSTIKAYLKHDFIMAVTGSKFLSGPTFCGALLIPETVARRFKKQKVPHAIRFYSARADWPSDWKASWELNDVANFGLLLRWEAALAELRSFVQFSEEEIAKFIQSFGLAMKQYFEQSDSLQLLSTPALNRGEIASKNGWDHLPTLFSFLVRRAQPGSSHYLSRPETKQIHDLPREDLSRVGDRKEAMSLAKRCQVGQPVPCGHQNGTEVSALRLCLSSRLIVEALSLGGRGSQAIIDDALAVLDKVAYLASLRSTSVI